MKNWGAFYWIEASLFGIIQTYVMQDIVNKEESPIPSLHACRGITDLMDETTLTDLISLKCESWTIKSRPKTNMR